MSKQAAPPAPRPKNAPPVGFVESLQERAARLGLTWAEAIRLADLNRQSAWRLSKGMASLATARRVESALDEIERRRGSPTTSEREAALALWIKAGRELVEADPARFEQFLGHVRLLLERIRLEREADAKLHEILSPKPR